MSAPESLMSEPLLVACLCAEWCGVCREYRLVMTRALETFDAGCLKVVWVDVEDHDEVLGELEVESFPTLLIARDDNVLFFGAVPPHAQTLERLVRSALAGDLPRLPLNPEVQTLLANVRVLQATAD